MTPNSWLDAHPYLRPLADFSAEVDGAAAGIESLDARVPDWDDYRADFLAGVPLLSSADAASISSLVGEWRERFSNDWPPARRRKA